MKKLGLLLMTIILAVATAGCGGSASTKAPQESSSGSAAASSTNTNAEGYPNKQIKMVIPYPPGGATDVIFRMIASEAEKHLGQPIVPVNVDGASSTIGSRQVKDADPDGYTILASHDVIATAYLTGVVDYSFEAFEPIALLTQTPNIPTVHKSLGIKTVKEFADYVKKNPGQFKWSIIPGSTDHFFMAHFVKDLGLTPKDLKLVSFKGTGPQVTSLVAEETNGGMFNIPSAKAYYEEGSFIPLGIAHDQRLGQLPDVPTLIDQGVNIKHATSRGLFAPIGTPEEIIVKIESAFKKVLDDPVMQKKIVEEQGSIPKFLPHKEYKVYLDELQANLTELSKEMDLKKQ